MSRELKILLVEDEVTIAMLMKIRLKKADYLVSKSVVSGEEAVSTSN